MPVVDSVHRLPAGTRVVERADRLAELARGRSVIDLGFVDEQRMSTRRADGMWLHDRLAAVAREIAAVDADAEGVEQARELGVDAYAADCTDAAALAALGLEPAELVVAGELIEHIDRPADFLEAVKTLVAPDGRLVLTTPNGPSLTNFAAALLHREVVNVDHVAWYSRRTLRTLLERHGWRVEELSYYYFPRIADADAAARAAGRAPVAFFRAYQRASRPLLRLWPELADGLLVVARQA